MLPPKTRRHAFECADMCAHMDIMKHANIKQHSLPLKYTVYAHLHPPPLLDVITADLCANPNGLLSILSKSPMYLLLPHISQLPVALAVLRVR